jgi:hypothetical protein
VRGAGAAPAGQGQKAPGPLTAMSEQDEDALEASFNALPALG